MLSTQHSKPGYSGLKIVAGKFHHLKCLFLSEIYVGFMMVTIGLNMLVRRFFCNDLEFVVIIIVVYNTQRTNC